MECPECGLIHPPTTDACECGYAFTPEGRQVRTSRIPRRQAPAHALLTAMAVLLSIIIMLWLFGPEEPKPKAPPPQPSALDSILALRGQIVRAAKDTVCLPSVDAWTRLSRAAVDHEEFIRAVLRETRSAGWPGTLSIHRGEQIKVLDADVTWFNGTFARVRPSIAQWLDEGCWVPADAVARPQ